MRTLDDAFLHPVFESIGHFTKESLAALRTKNGPFARRRTSFRSQVKAYSDEDMITKFHLQTKKETPITIPESRVLADLQRYCGFDMISIPDLSPTSKPEEFEKYVTQMSEKFIFPYTNAEPIPYVDMAMDEELFKKKVDAIWDNSGTFSVMGVIFRAPPQYMANYEYLREKRDRDIWVHASGVYRTYPHDWTASVMHLPQIYGIDTVSVLSQKIGVTPKPKPIWKVRRYDRNTLGLLELKDYIHEYGRDLECECPVCEGKNIDAFVRNYSTDHNGGKDLQLLNKWCKLHETFTSQDEFRKGKQAIQQDDFEDYAKEKKYLWNLINNFQS